MGPIATDDAENGSSRTMAGVTGNAQGAFAAACVDLADNSFADLGRIGRAFNNPDEFMPDGSFKSSVALYDLKISITDARKSDAHNCFVFGRRLGLFGKTEDSV
jgi:hypothetical protein